MSKIELLNQPYGKTLVECLNKLILTNKYSKLNIVVAFAKSRGVDILRDAITDFRAGGGTAEFYVGFALNGTSIEALRALYELADNLYLLHSSSHETFHPKIYNLCGGQEAVLIVGSNNLTDGGLRTNVESSVITFLALDIAEDLAIQTEIEEYLSTLRVDDSTCVKIESKSELEQMFQDGVILDEKAIREIRKSSAQSTKAGKTPGRFTGHFGTVTSAVPLERSTKECNQSEEDARSQETDVVYMANSMWVETGKGTGGSNNQLDLSKIAVIAPGDPGNELGTTKKITKGSVCFFGIDPEATDEIYAVDIEYNGQFFIDSKIKIYKGEGKGAKPNGTWRIYLCGACGDTKLSQALKADGLAHKLAVFSKHDRNYYLLELRDESEIEDYRAKSKIVAHSGRRLDHRAFGLMI